MVKNLEAQNNNNADENEIHFRELCISKKNKLCIIKGEPVRLTKTELELLVFFLSNPYYIYNNCSHEAAYIETGMQAVSYTTGVPACIGAMMFLTGKWNKPGVHNVEE